MFLQDSCHVLQENRHCKIANLLARYLAGVLQDLVRGIQTFYLQVFCNDLTNGFLWARSKTYLHIQFSNFEDTYVIQPIRYILPQERSISIGNNFWIVT